MRKVVFLLWLVVFSAAAFGQQTSEGSLYATGKQGTELGSCPLKSTAVRSDISGFVARVSVKQEFENTFAEPIEAVYVFPLSQNGAVDTMTMTVGNRIIRGKIMRRDEARKTYETAKAAGQTAALLDQERTNVFTQSVANIMPGERVIVEISYVETLKYEDGAYEFVFPMTVAPRYIPEGVKDAGKISPPLTTRNGSDISVEVNLNAGVPVEEIRSSSHEIEQLNFSPNAAKITLKNEKTIPNKDFVLKYDVTGKRIEDAILTHRDARGGFFTLILQPPDKVAAEDRTPKEIVFVLDTSGSMSGFPIEKAKEAMKLSLDGLYPEDTFNIITFAGDTRILFPAPVPATQANLDTAQNFLAGRSGGGGTEMMTAIKAALDPTDSQEHLRIVCFMTDGLVGNEDEIVAEVKRHQRARVFSFGIGSSVNRALLDKIAQEGKGEATYVGLQDDGSKAAAKFYERVRTPLLTDLSIDWEGMPVADVYPGKLTDLFSAKPVILHGRYTKPLSGTIKLKGTLAGAPYERSINLVLPETETANDSLATLWARTRVDELSSTRLMASDAKTGAEIDSAITNLGLEFGIMTRLTSFVAVEDRISNPNGAPTMVPVPGQIPDGMKPGGFEAEYGGATGGVVTQRAIGGGGGGTNLPVNGRSLSNLSVSSIGTVNASVTVVTKSGSAGKKKPKQTSSGLGTVGGVGYGSGNGMGSGSGGGMGNGSGVAATVNVSSGEISSVDTTQTKVSTTIDAKTVQELPKGTTFASMLKLSPGVAVQPLSGGFQIDGASGSENVFVIDGQEVTNLRTGAANTSGNYRLTGKAIAIAEPFYPEEARVKKALGEVVVEVTTDREGTILTANATSGDETLYSACESAALLSKFAPTLAGSERLRVSGEIVYHFTSADSVTVTIRKMKAQPPTEADRRASAMAQKMHFWVYELVTRLENRSSEPTANEAKFVRDGMADIRVELAAVTADAIQKLKAVGLEPVGQNARAVSGRIPIERLASLAAMPEIKLILPRN